MVNASATITASNVFTQSHANVYNLINDRTNVPDPNDSSGARKFVYVREPLSMGRGFKGYPAIIVQPVDYDQGDDPKTVSGTKNVTGFEIKIIVWSQDRHSDSDGNSTGRATLDSISDSIAATLNANKTTLRNWGMKKLRIDTNTSYTEDNGKAIFGREFTLIFTQLGCIV